MIKKIDYAIIDTRLARFAIGWKSIPNRRYETWLKVHGHVLSPDGEWSFVDESLEIPEVEELVAWLRRFANEPAPTSIDFLEPCLSFEATPADGRNVLLRVRFIGEVAPPWLWGDSYAVWKEGYWLDLKVMPAQLERFADGLEKRLKK